MDLGKTGRSRRKVPLSGRALDALDALPARLDTPLLFPAPGGGLLNLDNWRRRQWGPAIEASGVRRPARIYDLRSTFASNALAAGVSVFRLARVMGTSVPMIERHYGAMLDGSGAEIAGRLDAFEAAMRCEMRRGGRRVNLSERRATLAAAISRQVPGVEAVDFDEDGEHVYVEHPERGVVVRYVLGAEARQFLHGEFEGGELPEVVLLAPGHVDD